GSNEAVCNVANSILGGVSVRQVVCLDRRSHSLLPLLSKKGGEGRREEAVFHQFPLSPALSPLVPRGERGKNALRVFHAERYWQLRHWIGFSDGSHYVTCAPCVST